VSARRARISITQVINSRHLGGTSHDDLMAHGKFAMANREAIMGTLRPAT